MNIMNNVIYQIAFKIHSKNTGPITPLYFPDIMAYIGSDLTIKNQTIATGRK